ncbi:MAG TPA: vWA domain-containing protein [Polyangiaceae bacterium]|nr:vWA domain-containing protein [Polyangiaceae bacterium]
MRALRVLGFGLFVSALGSAAVGCSPSSDNHVRGNEGGGNSSGSSATTGGTVMIGNGGATGGVSVGVGGNSAGNGSEGGNGGGCAKTSKSAELIPLDLYVMMDSSKSMNEPTGAGVSKWKAITDAMTAFFKDPNSAGLNVGLKYFPDEQPNVPEKCTDDAQCMGFGPCDQRKACAPAGKFTNVITADTLCDANKPCSGTDVCAPVQRCADGPNCMKVYCVSGGTGEGACPTGCVPFDGYCRSRDVCAAPNYATPAVAFGKLPDAAQALSDSFAARMPGGYTPTGPALAGALQQAQERAAANPTHKVVVVLVTDGLPGGFIPNSSTDMCMPNTIDGVAMLAKAANDKMPRVPTFVIGVFGPCDLVDANVRPQENLDKLASSGGTSKAVVINTANNVTQQLQDALKLVRTTAIACQYTIPKPAEGTLDPTKVNVEFTTAGMTTTVGHAPNKAGCDPTRGGWYYDVENPDTVPPTQIIACDQSCAQFNAASDARVDIALGCKTVEIR